MRQMGGRSSGYASVSGDIRQAWVDLMRELGQTHPELVGGTGSRCCCQSGLTFELLLKNLVFCAGPYRHQ